VEVENEIAKWSGMLQVGEGEAKYKADCSNCGKSTMVPFEPKEGRPVYCKECMYKIKNGELKPAQGFVASRSANQEERVSTAPLSALGIEYQPVSGSNAKVPTYAQNNFSASKNVNPPQRTFGSDTRQNHPTENRSSHFTEKKHSGPSPLLRGLLEKIGMNGKEPIPNKEGIKIEETVAPAQKPISLSELKKHDEVTGKTANTQPSKEASEEKKASLKDILAKAMISEHKPEIKEEAVKPVEIIKEEPIVQPKIEDVKKEEPNPASVQDSSVAKEEKNDSWQKHKVTREVPEDVLRKVLE
jgi:CxxC-x17-CxxC domain-containing protein